MNFLAHVYLGGDNKEVVFGNFIGDFVKGDYKKKYPKKIALGISLHREIDHFTDHHELFKKSKSRLKNIYGHYPPVIIDIFYDHLLAKNWDNYHDTPLKTFTEHFYSVCQPMQNYIPSKSVELFKYMVEQNWLFNYSNIEGIESTFRGLSRRSSFKSNMEKATEDLITHYQEFEEDFNTFFPLVIDFSKEFVSRNSN